MNGEELRKVADAIQARARGGSDLAKKVYQAADALDAAQADNESLKVTLSEVLHQLGWLDPTGVKRQAIAAGKP